ncbi:MAG: tetratricopeptide repeat protein [Bacteroidota bacterium]
MPNFKSIFIWCLASIIIFACTEKTGDSLEAKVSPYLNHSDSARYVGIQTCASCHQDIYNSFMKTGMGSSFGPATKTKSAADFNSSCIYDSISDFYYKAFWSDDKLFFKEFRLNSIDTVYRRLEKIDFIVGSGQHTNSHLQMINGYINQAPMTFYTQKQKWDLPPGFEVGHNSRFSRPIGLECMSCHNAFPDFVSGSENKFSKVPQGIDCERCHGPGSIHVAQKMRGEIVDTGKYIDYSIVNPAKLPIERQFDICMRCHLQGNAVLAEGKSWFDFRPGMKLSDYIRVFLPRYSNSEEDFIMASHADRLSQSKCFIYSLKKNDSDNNQLKPFKNALTCVTCHNPHKSVKTENSEKFNNVCKKCHGDKKVAECNAPKEEQASSQFNCVKCNMPSSGSIDIPHVTIHDHYIRKPLSKKEIQAVKKFVGLYAVNIKYPDSTTRAKAYVNQFEKFERNFYLLDSAERFLKKNYLNDKDLLAIKIQILFNRGDLRGIVSICNSIGQKKLLESIFNKKSLSNDDAWTNYRVGEAMVSSGEISDAIKFYSKSVELAPFHVDFKLKYGVAFQISGNAGEARKIFTEALLDNPRVASIWVNLGYLEATEGRFSEAENNYKKALEFDPDNVQALTNFGALRFQQKDFYSAADYFLSAIKLNKKNIQLVNVFLDIISRISQTANKKELSQLIIKFEKIFPSDMRARNIYSKTKI